MRTAILNRTYRNAIGTGLARVNVTGTDALRKQLADAFFPARHVVRHRGVPVCLTVLHVGLTPRRLPAAKPTGASAGMLESISSSMAGVQRSKRWSAERRSPIAFAQSA